MVSSPPDVLIVGAGVIGLSCALELLDRGRSVTVLDAGRAGGGSSHGNCGTITPSHAPPLAGPGMVGQALRWMLQPDAPLYIRPRWDPQLAAWLLKFAGRCNRRDWLATAQAKGALLQASRRALEDWVTRHRLDCEFASAGLVYVFRRPALFDAHVRGIEDLRQLGIPVDLWDAARLQREEPALREGMAGALHFSGDARLRPDRLVASLLARVRERGGVVRENAAVVRIDPAGDRPSLLLADGERFAAAQLVLAAGAWSPRFADDLGLNIPIQPGKGYSITYDRPAFAPLRPLVLKDRSVCVTTWGTGFRLGSTMEFSGYDTSLNRVRLDALVRGAREFLHEPEGPVRQEEWYGWRPMTWDDLPLIGPLPRHPRVLLASGHGMMGVSMSTVTAQLIGALACGGEPPLDPQPYRVDRFG